MSGMELKAWRKRLGLTQREAAEMLEVSVLTLSAWEIGRFRIGQPGLLKLACRMVEMQLTQSSELLSQSRLDDHLPSNQPPNCQESFEATGRVHFGL